MTALYIHWPFCKKKCPYCDFNSHVRANVDADRWQAAMVLAMERMAAYMPDAVITSVFFGGGTPSLMPPALVAALLTKMQASWQVADNIEITLEANPTSSEAERFQAFFDAGINRVSLGIQSLDNDALAFLGRQHSAVEALEAAQRAARIFPRYSLDMIYARPGQTVNTWTQELTQLLTYTDGHASLYQLTVEPDTPFARLYAAGGFTLPDDDLAADLYECTATLCAQKDLHPYEISNYARIGQESRHNISYWNGDSYIGIGPGAHGRLCSHEKGWRATTSIYSPERWLHDVLDAGGAGLESLQPLTQHERCVEQLLSGARLTAGIPIKDIASVLNHQKYQQLQASGYIGDGDRLQITAKGRLLTEHIISELLL